MENLKSDSPREDDDGNERFKSISCQGYNNNAYPLVVDNAYNTEALTTAVNLTESMANISLNIDICQNENHNYMVAINDIDVEELGCDENENSGKYVRDKNFYDYDDDEVIAYINRPLTPSAIATTYPESNQGSFVTAPAMHATTGDQYNEMLNMKLLAGSYKAHNQYDIAEPSNSKDYNNDDNADDEMCDMGKYTYSDPNNACKADYKITHSKTIPNIDIDGAAKYITNRRDKLTPYQIRLKFAQIYNSCGSTDNIIDIAYNLKILNKPNNDNITLDKEASDQKELHEFIVQNLYCDVVDIYKYRQTANNIDAKSFKHWFPDYPLSLLDWLDENRDFIYNSHGLRLLKNRYLRKNEPIQYCMLRIARLFVSNDSNINTPINNTTSFEYYNLIIYYQLISCGFIQVSSILADSDQADESTIIRGEACRLVTAIKDYGREFIKQMESVCTMISLGVGVGMDASGVPTHGRAENGHIHGGFFSLAKKLDSCNHLSIYQRKPKIAMYVSIHNDSIYEVFNLRNPAKEHLENVFFGVMINDYFMECVRNDEPWYLFPGNATLSGIWDNDGCDYGNNNNNNNNNGNNDDNQQQDKNYKKVKYLSDYKGFEYVQMYKQFVNAKLYTTKTKARTLMDALLHSLCETGSPYVVWDDVLNRYSNHSHLGKIKTLNLCAEITNYSSPEESSSCTLLSLNCAMFKDFPHVAESMYSYLRDIDDTFKRIVPKYQNQQECKFAYMLGYMATRALNDFMGPLRNNRELGISPMGVYDMAIMNNKDPVEIVGEISEALYLGAIQSSCAYYQKTRTQCARFKDSAFSYGIPQWMLRNTSTHIEWPERIFAEMRYGMANSMLTAQAPTATTSMLCGVTESVMLPTNIIISKESENGRNLVISYGIIYSMLNQRTIQCGPFKITNDIDSQIAMYANSAPFIDQSQSTIFSLEISKQNIFDLLKKTYLAELKTAIYYVQPKLLNPTLEIIRSTNLQHAEFYKKYTIKTMDDVQQQQRQHQKMDEEEQPNNNHRYQHHQQQQEQQEKCYIGGTTGCDACAL